MELRIIALGLICLSSSAQPHRSEAAEPLPFRATVVNAQSEFTAATAIDVNADGKLDIVSGGFWYEAPNWTHHKLRDVERIGTRFDDYSNLTLDVDGDGDSDLVSVNYRSKSLYWVRNPGPIASQSGTLWERVEIDTPGPSETGRLLDVDGDGQADVLPNGTTFAAWYSFKRETDDSNNTTVRWTKHDLPQELAGHGIGSGDINGDGRIDLVNPNGWAEAPLNPRSDRWVWHDEFQLPRDGSVPILVHDVDGDGDTDLVWGRGHNVGLYWTEQQRNRPAQPNARALELLSRVRPEQRPSVEQLLGRTIWITHAIDTSFSCLHAPLLADLNGDGELEIVAGKRFQGHEGKDPGENEPLRVVSYQFDRGTRTWTSRIISRHPVCGLDLDPKCVDIDRDGDLDLICPARSGLVLLENLHKHSGPSVPREQQASYQAPLPENIVHNDFHSMLTVRDGQPVEVPIDSALALGNRREQIQRQMELVMGDLPDSHLRTPLNVEVLSIETLDKYTRIKLTYEAEPGDRVPTWILIPHASSQEKDSTQSEPKSAEQKSAGATMSQRMPGMLCLHPTQFELGKDQLLGLGGKPSRFYAHELAEAGFVCIAPDYPGFGEYKYDFATQGKHYASGTMKAIWNNLRALDLLESLPCVAPDAIGCIGHSLGGHNALYTAAFDVRIRAVMSSCGFNAFEDYYGGNLKGWTSDRYMPRIATVYGSDPRRMPFDFHEVLAAIAPRPLLVNAPLHDANFAVEGVRKCEAAARVAYTQLNQRDAFTVLYPDAEHDFPEEIRRQTYDWFKSKLRSSKN